MTETSLPTSNKAVVWVGPKKLEIQERPVHPPGDNEVLVEIVATGICGSDCHNWESDKVSRQLVLGHESSGIIIKVGKCVKDRFVGQRVAVEPGFACMNCEFCVKGNPNICANLKYCGLDPTDGTLCQYFTCMPSMTVPIPDTVSWEEAGAIQPLAIAVQLARRASLNAHQTMAILYDLLHVYTSSGRAEAVLTSFVFSGCGPLGLLVLAVAKAYGVKKVIMFDIESSRTQFAETYGATVGIVPPKNEDPSIDSLSFYHQYAKQLNSEHDLGNGFDVTVEASGAEACIQMAVVMLKSGGTCIQAGLGKPLTSVPLFLVTAKELNIRGTVRYTPGCFADAISLLERNLVDLKPLITSTYPLTQASQAFEAQHSRKDIKIVILNQT
ncbi:alcohol dehydrogenase GroES-like domain-containing protein [Colletotrichum asianum]|uniref:D-xylulose reductase n=1 Tax=Colletotrichum asianum TaxID=702518 RepID=A0A8H3ZRN7_9PEZI|nr:alcohol dehydrogenase GroES-like domain-containing protein [Colletotrichum asianum]